MTKTTKELEDLISKKAKDLDCSRSLELEERLYRAINQGYKF